MSLGDIVCAFGELSPQPRSVRKSTPGADTSIILGEDDFGRHMRSPRENPRAWASHGKDASRKSDSQNHTFFAHVFSITCTLFVIVQKERVPVFNHLRTLSFSVASLSLLLSEG